MDFERANLTNGSAQALVSSHSPFLVSSLPRQAISSAVAADGRALFKGTLSDWAKKTPREEPFSQT